MYQFSSKNKLLLWIGIVILLAGCGIPQATLTTTPFSTQTTTLPSTPTTVFTSSLTPTIPGPTPTAIPHALRVAVIHEPGWNADILLSAPPLPNFVNINPDGKILFTGQHLDSIFEVREGGNISVFATFPGMNLEAFYYDSLGQLWLSTNSQGIYRVTDEEQPVRIAEGGVNRWFDFDSLNNLYAVDSNSTNIQKITPTGEISVLIENVSTTKIMIGPNDEIIFMDITGRLVQVMPDGELRIIATQLGFDSKFAFAPDGTLYNLDWSGLSTINIETGLINRIHWYDRFNNSGNGLAFDNTGTLYTYHPSYPIYKIDLEEQTSQLIYRPRVNTTAMAIGPEGYVYVAYGDLLPSGQSTIYRIIDEQSLEEVVRVPYGLPISLAFDDRGTGYIGVADREKDQKILTFDLSTGAITEYVQPLCYPNSIGIDPTTNYLWWFSCDLLHYKDEAGNVHNLSIPANTSNKNLFFGPNGQLYAIFWLTVTGSAVPLPHGVFTLEEDGTWVELADLSSDDPDVSLAMGAVCPDNKLYVITHLDAQALGVPNYRGNLNGVLRIEPDGTLEIVAGGFSVDPFIAACDQKSGDLIFTAQEAVYRLYRTSE